MKKDGRGMNMNLDLQKNLLESLFDGVYFVDQERRITYWNKGAEMISGFSSSGVLAKIRDIILVFRRGWCEIIWGCVYDFSLGINYSSVLISCGVSFCSTPFCPSFFTYWCMYAN